MGGHIIIRPHQAKMLAFPILMNIWFCGYYETTMDLTILFINWNGKKKYSLILHVYGLLAVRLSKFSEIVYTWINRGIEYYAYNK